MIHKSITIADAIQLISSNSIASALVVAAILAIVGVTWKWHCDHRDSKKILGFMLQSKSETDFTFRSTEAISSGTKIPENRVAELCSKHPRIKRSEKKKQSWQTVD